MNMAPTNTQVSIGGDVTKESNKPSSPGCTYVKHCVTPDMTEDLLQHDDSQGDGRLLDVVKMVREMLCCDIHPAPPDCDTRNVQTILQAQGCVAKFVELLKRDDQWILQRDSSLLLANIAFEGRREAEAVVEAGAVPNLVTALDSPQAEVRLFSAWAVMNICGHHPPSRRLLLDLDIITKLLPLLGETVECMQTAVLTLRHLCRAEPSPAPSFNKLSPCLGPLAALTTHSDEEVSKYACYALVDVGLAHGTSLLTVLSPAFIQNIDHLPAQSSYRPSAVKLAAVVKNIKSNNCLPTQMTTSQRMEDDSPVRLSEDHERTPTKRSATSSIKLGRASAKRGPKRRKMARGRPSRP